MKANSIVPAETTGDTAFDAILGGGLPSQSVTVIAGEPGSGKTILTLQFLFNAARRGRKCLYFTTISEPALKVIRYMQGFEFFDAALLDEHVVFADLGSFIAKGTDETLAEIGRRVEASEPSFVAIDSFRSIGEMLRVETARPFVNDLATQLAAWGATTLLVGEYAREEYSRFVEFGIADGIIRVGSHAQGLTSVRELEILKLRGANYVSGRHFFDIERKGIRLYPRVRAPGSTGSAPPRAERDGTGIEGLDELLGGGLPSQSATLVQGATGTGKTLLALSFLMEGIRKNEKCVLFTLEETPDQLRKVASGFGWDLAAHEANGSLVIRYTSPVELSTDRFLNEARNEVEALGADRVVLDSLTSMSLGVTSEVRFKELVYAITKHMRSAGASFLLTVEAEQLIGIASLSALGVSFICDNLIQLRYVEIDGRIERAISVIKSRGIKFNTELRAATIGPGGMTVVGGRFKDLRGVLTGIPSSRTS